MDQFVLVRLVQTNGLDLARFQFDFDLTFAAFFMNADGTIYGRYGSRSSIKESMRDISLEGFGKAMTGALALHKAYPTNRAALSGKRGPTPRFPVPERYPSLTRYTPRLDYGGQVSKSCMHCHMIADAERLMFRKAEKPVPDRELYPWPMPDVVGLALDPNEKAKVLRVASGSAASRSGFRAGDEILTLAGQPLLSTADVQWVLHQAGAADEIAARVRRGGETVNLTLTLDDGWRRKSDISWRVTSWELRRMATGGLLLKPTTPEARRKAGLPDDKLALFVEHVGQYNEHAVAKRAGFRKGDIIVEFDGRSDAMRETDLFAYVLRNRMPGARVPVTVVRNGKRVEMTLRMQ